MELVLKSKQIPNRDWNNIEDSFKQLIYKVEI